MNGLLNALLGAAFGYALNEILSITQFAYGSYLLIVLCMLGLVLSASYRDVVKSIKVTVLRFRRRKEPCRPFYTQREWEQNEFYIEEYLRDFDSTTLYLADKCRAKAKWWQFWIL